jgi:arsenite-transporting ATPase
VIDPNNPTSVNSALRYWGCTIQAGAQVSGAFGISSQQPKLESFESAKKDLSPLSSAFISSPLMNSPIDWSRVLLDTVNEDARHLLTSLSSQSSNMTSSVKFDVESKSVTLFMPGFDKSEIKLYQVRNILLLISFLFGNFVYNFILHGTPFDIFLRNKMLIIFLVIKKNEI